MIVFAGGAFFARGGSAGGGVVLAGVVFFAGDVVLTGVLLRRAVMTPLQPSWGQGPRQVSRPLGAVVVTVYLQTGQAPVTRSGSPM